MKLIEKIKKNISKILWYLVIILLFLSIYKLHKYYEYKKYVVMHIKKANFYDGLKILQESAKEYSSEINMAIKEYYLMPLEKKFVVIGNGGIYKGKKVYAIVLEFYSYNIKGRLYGIEKESYITNYEKFKILKESPLIYRLNDEKLEELYKKVEKKSDMI